MVEAVHLEHIEDFREALRDYHISSHGKEVLEQTTVVVVAGLAGGGRNTTINYLVEHHNYFFLVSDTTRPPKLRSGVMEEDGVNYYFRSEEEMLCDIQNGEFLEAELIHNQQVSGVSIRELERARQTERIAIGDFEFGGAHNIATVHPTAYIIGLLPPSFDALIDRLSKREEMSGQELRNRLQTGVQVLQNMLAEPYFKFVINHTVPQCAADIRAIVEKNKVDGRRQLGAKAVAAELLQQIRAQLVTLAQ